MSTNPTFLDVEDDEQRQERLGTLLEQLNTTSSSLSSAIPDTLLNIGRECPSGSIKPPPAELLARVQAFLPAISASNESLSQKKTEDIDIENIAEDEEEYIEMNLGLGVFEAKHRPRSASSSPMFSDAETDVNPSESDSDSDLSSSSSKESESESDYSSNDDSDVLSQSGSSIDMKAISSRPIKPLPRRVSQQAKLEV